MKWCAIALVGFIVVGGCVAGNGDSTPRTDEQGIVEKPGDSCDDEDPCTKDVLDGTTCMNPVEPEFTLCGGDPADPIHGECHYVRDDNNALLFPVCLWTEWVCVHGQDGDPCHQFTGNKPMGTCMAQECCLTCIKNGACFDTKDTLGYTKMGGGPCP